MTLRFDYTKALYRKNNQGQPCVWYANVVGSNMYRIHHGILGKTISYIDIITHTKPIDEINSKIKANTILGDKDDSDSRSGKSR